jgi:DNA-binding protein H-NS
VNQDLDLSRLRVHELRWLSERIAQEISRRSLRWRFGGGLAERSSPLYRDPQNPSQTWSGRGQPPAWVRGKLAAGTPLEKLRA